MKSHFTARAASILTPRDGSIRGIRIPPTQIFSPQLNFSKPTFSRFQPRLAGWGSIFDHPSISPNSELRGVQTHPGSSARPSYIESVHSQPEQLNRNRVIHFSVPKSVKIAKSRVGQNLAVCVCAHRESNRLPPASQSDALPTRVLSPQKIAPLTISYASKIRVVCPRARRGFFRAQNIDFECSASKIAFLQYVYIIYTKNTPKSIYSRL